MDMVTRVVRLARLFLAPENRAKGGIMHVQREQRPPEVVGSSEWPKVEKHLDSSERA